MATKKKLTDTFLVSEELLKLHSPISRNVDVEKIVPFLTISQPYYIEPILGTALMEELQSQVESGEITEENKALLLKIAPALSNWTTYLALRSLAYSITEKSITKEHSENSEALTEKELGEYILSTKNLAEMSTKLLIKYLCRCADLYPLWKPDDDCHCNEYADTDGSATPVFKSVVYFPNKKKSNGCNEGCM